MISSWVVNAKKMSWADVLSRLLGLDEDIAADTIIECLADQARALLDQGPDKCGSIADAHRTGSAVGCADVHIQMLQFWCFANIVPSLDIDGTRGSVSKPGPRANAIRRAHATDGGKIG